MDHHRDGMNKKPIVGRIHFDLRSQVPQRLRVKEKSHQTPGGMDNRFGTESATWVRKLKRWVWKLDLTLFGIADVWRPKLLM